MTRADHFKVWNLYETALPILSDLGGWHKVMPRPKVVETGPGQFEIVGEEFAYPPHMSGIADFKDAFLSVAGLYRTDHLKEPKDGYVGFGKDGPQFTPEFEAFCRHHWAVVHRMADRLHELGVGVGFDLAKNAVELVVDEHKGKHSEQRRQFMWAQWLRSVVIVDLARKSYVDGKTDIMAGIYTWETTQSLVADLVQYFSQPPPPPALVFARSPSPSSAPWHRRAA